MEVSAIRSRAVRLHWEQAAAFRVENEEKSIEKNQRVAVNLDKICLGEAILLQIDETGADIFEHSEDALPQFLLEIGLQPKRLLSDAIKETLPRRATLERRSTEERKENPNLLQRAELTVSYEMEGEVGPDR